MAGRAPLIIAVVAALVAYAAFGNQSPFGFLHHFSRHHSAIAVSTDKQDATDDARQTAEDRVQQEADRAQERADRAQEMRDRAQEMSERAKDMAQTAAETAKTAVSAIPPIPAIPALPPLPVFTPASPASNESRTLDPFESVTIDNNATATITIGDTQSVSLSGETGQTVTRVRDGKLTVSGSTPGVHVAITLPHLRALQVNGYGQVDLQGLRDPITIKANGSVQLSASGMVDSAELTLNGPSKFSLAKLEAKNLVVQVNGVGDADVYATENLVADVKGVGHVSYRGSPHLVTKINGPGSVQHVASNEG